MNKPDTVTGFRSPDPAPFVKRQDAELTQIAEDLATLLDGPEIDIAINFDEVLVCVKSHGKVLWEGTTPETYKRGEGPQRAQFLLSWLHGVAETYRRNQTLLRQKGHKKKAS